MKWMRRCVSYVEVTEIMMVWVLFVVFEGSFSVEWSRVDCVAFIALDGESGRLGERCRCRCRGEQIRLEGIGLEMNVTVQHGVTSHICAHA